MIGLLKRSGVNLRGDLAKLDDAALAARLDETLRGIERLVAARGGRGFDWLDGGGLMGRHAPRGLLRARLLYRLGWYLPILLQLWLNSGTVVGAASDERALYLAHCEAKDLMDEIRRRLEARRRTKA